MKISDLLEGYGRYGSRNPDLMSPSDYDRWNQDQMDYDKRDFKRREMEHELGHEEEPRYQRKRSYSSPASKGMYFYNVPAGKESDAQQVGLFRTKSGKWYSPFQNSRADMFFGKGRFWQPKNEGVAESASAGATGSGSIASVANPGSKPASQVGSLFGGSYGESGKKKKSKVVKR